jgi:hypothetical protein
MPAARTALPALKREVLFGTDRNHFHQEFLHEYHTSLIPDITAWYKLNFNIF